MTAHYINGKNIRLLLLLVICSLSLLLGQCSPKTQDPVGGKGHIIITSDTILGSMVSSLLPQERYKIEPILPPGQCPGHYDVRLSDLERIKKAGLIIYFKGMPFMGKVSFDHSKTLLIDTEGNNWMTPDHYLYGINIIADNLTRIFPEDAHHILVKKENEIKRIRQETYTLKKKIQDAGITGKKVIASSMQKQPLEWMGFNVVADYSRPEAMTAKDVLNLIKIGKNNRVIIVVDNLQSGPDTGRGIAESLGIAHVILTNFPSEKGYVHTLNENVDKILEALR